MSKPKLRFKEFNSEWKNEKLSELSSIIDGDRGKNYPKENDFFDNEYCLFLNAGNVTKQGFNFNNKLFITKEKDELLRNGKLIRNDIVLTTRGTVGNVVLYDNVIPYDNVRINSGMVIIRNNDSVIPKYLYSYMKSQMFENQVSKTNFGSAQPQLTIKGLEKFSISYPDKNEQVKVSNFLSLLDKKIELQSKKIEDLKLFKKGLSNKIFSSIDVIKEEKLGNICNITTGKLDANAMVENGQYRFYTCAKDYYYIDKYAFDTEALLISGNGAYVGYIHYYKGKFNAYQRTYVLDKFTENIQYIKVYLDEFLSKRINSEKKEGNTPYIVLSTLSDMKIKLINYNDENKVINTFNNINIKINKEELKLNKLIELKKGLMQNMFV
ncbi:MAG: restriction endonuclease subunit S [Bacilli bacterium]|nr:restriction endonuclease subunit S [Bacilli bacterium]